MASKEQKEYLTLLYQASQEEVRHAKQQQWLISLFGIGLQTILIASYGLLQGKETPAQPWEKGALIVLSLLAAVFCTRYFLFYQRRYLKFRRRIRMIRVILIQDLERILDDVAAVSTSVWYDFLNFLLPFLLPVWASCFCACWILLR